MPASYSFKQIFAADPSNPGNIASNGSILLYAPGDATKTPLVITDLSGALPIANPVTVNSYGFGPPFSSTLNQVAWEGGGFNGTFESYEGMRDEAVAAVSAATTAAGAADVSRQAAEDAAINAAAGAAAGAASGLAAAVAEATAAKDAAAASAALVGAPADTAVQTLINTPASATAAALHATYAPVTGSTTYRNRVDGPERVAFGGDSNTAYNSGVNWTAYLTALSSGYAMRIGLFATGGFTLANWHDTFLPQILALTGPDRPDSIVLMLGTNDVLTDVPTKIAYYRDSIITPLINAGIRPIICTIPPRSDSTSTQQWGVQYNSALLVLADALKLGVLDVYAQLVDPSTGTLLAAYDVDGIDGSGNPNGIHFFIQAAQTAIAKGLRAPFIKLMRGTPARTASTNTDMTNICTNPLLLTPGGKWNGSNGYSGLASGWQSTAGLTIASGAPTLYTDAYGRWQRLKDIDLAVNQDAAPYSNGIIPVTPGRRYRAVIKARPVGFNGGAKTDAHYGIGAGFYAAASGGSMLAPMFGIDPSQHASSLINDTDPSDALIFVAELVAPATSAYLRIVANYGKGSTGSMVGKTLDYGVISVRDVTPA